MSRVDPLLGAAFAGGRYTIERLLGTGGMGAVYLARQTAMNRPVALKVLHASLDANPDLLLRFHQEMRASAKVEHPNTIRVYDFGETEGKLFLVMELLDGSTLRRVLCDERSFPPQRVVAIGLQVAKALRAAHHEGIVHRDLKPENVILLNRYGDRDFVKVLDFGIARSLEAGAERLTADGAIVGTPGYMAPEQARGKDVDARADLYALGIMLYEMACGSVPFERPTVPALLMAKITEPAPPILERAPNLAPGLADLIMRLLARDPADRPANADPVVELLERELQSAKASEALPASFKTGRCDVSKPVPDVGAELAKTAERVRPQPPVVEEGPNGIGQSGKKALIASAALAVLVIGGFIAIHRANAQHSLRVSASRAALEVHPALAGEVPAPAQCVTAELEALERLLAAANLLKPETGAADPKAAAALLGDGGSSPEKWAMLARARLAMGANPSALEAAGRALALCPSYASASNLSGKAAHKLGKLDEAEAAYRQALAGHDDFVPPRFNLGVLRLMRNDPAGAILALDEVIARAPDAEAHFYRGRARLLSRDAQGAAADLRETLRRDDTNAAAWLLLGKALFKQDRIEDAQTAFCKAKELGLAEAASLCTP